MCKLCMTLVLVKAHRDLHGFLARCIKLLRDDIMTSFLSCINTSPHTESSSSLSLLVQTPVLKWRSNPTHVLLPRPSARDRCCIDHRGPSRSLRHLDSSYLERSSKTLYVALYCPSRLGIFYERSEKPTSISLNPVSDFICNDLRVP